MTNVSPHKLRKNESKKLVRHFTQLMSTDSNGSIFCELFTEAEQTMLVKRLAIILMLERGYSMYRISKTMHVSDTTVARIAHEYERCRYTSLIAAYQKYSHSNREDLWNALETLLRVGLPPRDQHRWKYILRD